MNIVESRNGAVTVVRVEGRLDAATSPEFERRTAGLIEAGARRLVVDCSTLDYVSSAGLRAFLILANRLTTAKGRLVLAAPTPAVQEIFDIAGFPSILTIFNTLDEGVRTAAR